MSRRVSGRQELQFAIGIVLDSSGSMQVEVKQARDAVARLLRTAVEGDEYFLIAFNMRARMLTDIVRNPDGVLQKIRHIRAGGWTALLDATELGLRIMRGARNPRKALVILSDGADNRSRLTEMELRNRVRESDTCVYALGLLGDGQSETNLRLLAETAQETGGLMLAVNTPADLAHAIEQIALNIRSQYVLS